MNFVFSTCYHGLKTSGGSPRETVYAYFGLLTAGLLWSGVSWAFGAGGEAIDLTGHGVGYTALILFGVAYAFVIAEEFTHLRKSKPVILAAGILWAMVAAVYAQHGDIHTAEAAVRHNVLEYAELFLFLLVAMTYINAMEERLVFEALRAWLVRKGFSYRQLFWITGGASARLGRSVTWPWPRGSCTWTGERPWGSVRRGRQHAVHRFGRRCGADGPGPCEIYFLWTPEVDAGHRHWLRCQHRGAYVDQLGDFLKTFVVTQHFDKSSVIPAWTTESRSPGWQSGR